MAKNFYFGVKSRGEVTKDTNYIQMRFPYLQKPRKQIKSRFSSNQLESSYQPKSRKKMTQVQLPLGFRIPICANNLPSEPNS